MIGSLPSALQYGSREALFSQPNSTSTSSILQSITSSVKFIHFRGYEENVDRKLNTMFVGFN